MKKLSDLMTVKIDISNRTVFRVLSIVLLFVLAVQLVAAAAQALLLIFVAFFLSIALSPPVNYLARKMPRKSRGLATAIVFIVLIAVVGFLVSSLLPPLVRQTNQLIDQAPIYFEQITEDDGVFSTLIDRFDIDPENIGEEVRRGVTEGATGAGEPIFNFLARVSTSIIGLLTVVVLTFFMLVEGPKWISSFWSVQSHDKRRKREQLAQKMYRVVTSYVNGQLLIATMNAAATALILVIMGVPFALSLAAIVGLLGLIPIIGATLGAIIVVAAGLFQSVTVAIVLAVYYIVYQQIENNIIQPAVQSKSLGMSPLLILVSVVIGLNLAGILGGLVAIPIAGCVRVFLLDYLDHRRQHKHA